MLAAERDAQLQSAIAALPERQRSVVILHQLEGHKTHEVGTMLGVSEATVRVHLFRALRALRARLSATRRERRRMVQSLGGAP